MLQVEAHRELALHDLGLVATMLARPTREERSGPAERVAARPLDMNDLGPEFRQLRADERLRDKDAGADRANTLERTEARRHRGVGGRCRIPDPIGDGSSKFLDLILVPDNARVVRHGRSPLFAKFFPDDGVRLTAYAHLGAYPAS